MYLPSMNDDDLVRYANQFIDPITSTDLERELIKRFEALLNDVDEPLHQAVDASCFTVKCLEDLEENLIGDTDNTVALLRALGKTDINSPEELIKLLNEHKDFSDLAAEAGDCFTRLATLSTTIQE